MTNAGVLSEVMRFIGSDWLHVSAVLLASRTFWIYGEVHWDFPEQKQTPKSTKVLSKIRANVSLWLLWSLSLCLQSGGCGEQTNVLISAHIHKLPNPTLRSHCVGIKFSLVLLQLLVCLCFAEERRKPRENVKKEIKNSSRMPKGTMRKQFASWSRAWQGGASLLSCCTFSAEQDFILQSLKNNDFSARCVFCCTWKSCARYSVVKHWDLTEHKRKSTQCPSMASRFPGVFVFGLWPLGGIDNDLKHLIEIV